jgi:hypothetical protein
MPVVFDLLAFAVLLLRGEVEDPRDDDKDDELLVRRCSCETCACNSAICFRARASSALALALLLLLLLLELAASVDDGVVDEFFFALPSSTLRQREAKLREQRDSEALNCTGEMFTNIATCVSRGGEEIPVSASIDLG